MDFSILFATCNRNDLLEQTLRGFTGLKTNGLSWEIILVDNAGNKDTKGIADSYTKLLPITYLVEKAPGKNNALNTGLEHASGELIIFTDDDVIPDPMLARELVDCAARWKNGDLFGGRILPKYPGGLPVPETSSNFFRSAYVIADWDLPEGELPVDNIWGPNMMIRRRVFDSGLRFDPSIGPKGSNYIMGSESEFCRRAYAAGYKSVYAPAALVYHQIRPEQLSSSWIHGRAFRTGRSNAVTDNFKSNLIWNIPRFKILELITGYFRYMYSYIHGGEAARLENAIAFHCARGYVYQCIVSKYGPK